MSIFLIHKRMNNDHIITGVIGLVAVVLSFVVSVRLIL